MGASGQLNTPSRTELCSDSELTLQLIIILYRFQLLLCFAMKQVSIAQP